MGLAWRIGHAQAILLLVTSGKVLASSLARVRGIMGTQQTTDIDAVSFDAIVIGAGFGGMFMLHRLRQQGLSVKLLEQGSGLGGTWFWNRYPGARCDIQSMEYSYQFSEELQQEWVWSEKYATQPEILRYANHVADRFELREHMQFNSRVEGAWFDEAKSQWVVPVDGGKTYRARYCVSATGCLSSANTPDIPGIDEFSGPIYHTGSWPHEGVDFTGQRVAVIGTGSSAVQSIPIIACLLYTSPSPRDKRQSRMPSSA